MSYLTYNWHTGKIDKDDEILNKKSGIENYG